MSESWYKRFKKWICDNFGHRPEKETWEFDGHLIGCCKRCGVVYRIKKLSD